jgi:hypothetical protein
MALSAITHPSSENILTGVKTIEYYLSYGRLARGGRACLRGGFESRVWSLELNTRPATRDTGQS